MRLKIALRRSSTKCRPKFERVTGRVLHCFRRYRPVQFVAHPVLFAKRRQRVSGYMVSELSILGAVCGGRTVRLAIANTRARMNDKNAGAKQMLSLVRRGAQIHRSREGRRMFACV
jgi:hypothetical protein